MKREKWLEIEDLKEYFVSSFGRVKRVRNGVEFFPKAWKRDGYLDIFLQHKLKRAVHRLVAKAFIPNPQNLPSVDHIDRNKSNNNVENLRWVDSSTNLRNGVSHADSTSKFLGVSFHKEFKKYRANIYFMGKHVSLGSFTTEEEANFWRCLFEYQMRYTLKLSTTRILEIKEVLLRESTILSAKF